MSELRLALAVSARGWADALHRFTTDHGGALVRVRVMSERDAVEQDYDVLFADDTASFLSARLVSVLRAQDKAVVGVFEPFERQTATDFLGALGIEDVAAADLEPEQLLELAKNVATVPTPPTAVVTAPDAGASDEPMGELAVVTGVSGGVGATEVAIGLAQLGNSPRTLVDLDVLFPSVAQRLSMPLQPNLRSALDAHRHAPMTLDEQIVQVSSRLSIIPGVVASTDWDGMRPDEVIMLIHTLLRSRDVVANIPAFIAAIDRPTQQLRRQVMKLSSDVVVVTVPTPLGVTRLIEWAALQADALPGKLHVVFNRAPKSLYKRGESFDEAVQALKPASISFLAEDQAVLHAAWQGSLVKRGRFLKALAQLTVFREVA